MKAGSHRARYERLRQHDQKSRRVRRAGAWVTFATSLVTAGAAFLLLRILGRGVALGLAIAFGIFAIACGVAARRVVREKGRESVHAMVLVGLMSGLIGATAFMFDPNEGVYGVVAAAVSMGGVALLAPRAPSRSKPQ